MSGNCVKCGVWRFSIHNDHIIPKFAGGPDTPDNTQKLCANCHEDKSREDRKTWPNELKACLRSGTTGKKFTPEQLARHRASFTPKTRAQMSASAKARPRRPHSELTKARMRLTAARKAMEKLQ